MQKVWLYTAEIFVRTFFVSKKKEKKKRKKTTQRRELSKIRHMVFERTRRRKRIEAIIRIT